MAHDSNDFFAGYIEEVQTYIPIMQAGIEELRSNPGKRETLEEIYRLSHIIKGASSMVGITGLSRIAGCMENALDRIQEGQLALSDEAFSAMQATVDRFAQYCQGLQQGASVDEETLIALTEADFNRVGPGTGELFLPDTDSLLVAEDDVFQSEASGFAPDDELLGEFRAEAEEHLESLHVSMQHLETHVVGTVPLTNELREVVRKVRRSVHTIKGASAVIGLSDLASYAHLIEDILDWLYESAAHMDQQMVLPLSQSLDLLAAMIHAPASFDEQRAEEVLAQMHACMEAGQGDIGRVDAELSDDLLSKAVLEALEPPPPVKKVEGAKSEGSLQGSLFSEEEKELLREGFLEEAEEHFQEIHHALEILESAVEEKSVISPEQKEEVRRIRRAVHTIKGASAVIGLNDISVYAHGVEDFLDWLYESARFLDPALIGTLTESLDFLSLLVESPESAEADRQAALLKRLRELFGEDISAELLAEEPPQMAVVAEQPWAESVVEEESEEEAAPQQATASESVKTIRINQNQLDVLINLANELLVGISGFDRNMGSFKTALDELELTTRRLKDIALELETKFEVKALDQLSQHFAHLDKSVADIKSSQSFSEFDAMELDRYTQLNLIIRSLNESAIDVAALHTNLGGIYSGIGGDIGRQHRVIRELQVQMMRTRMSPMSTLTSRLSRTMRDVASRLGKRVRLVVEGERVELDRMVWEKLADPFMHLVRNAIHHGIESAEVRQARSKPAIATITLSGRREGNHILIRFGDDGQGLDFNAIREKARRFGLGDKVDRMDERQLTELIFYPGFSTKTISEISGRGVGMDVVRENVKDLQGSIVVETEPGVGTTFVLRIPLTLGVARSLMVTIGEITYGITLNDIKDIHRLEREQISVEEGTCMLAGEVVPWYSLPNLLGMVDPNVEEAGSLVLAMHSEGRIIALSIPQITGQKELVIKGLGSHLRSVVGLSGAAVMGDGSIVPVLDVPGLIQGALHAGRSDATAFALEIPSSFTVLIVDDSISIRRVMSRLVTANGWVPVEAKDGLDALEQLEMEEIRPDCIVLDIEMPRMNGFEFLAKLPNIPGGKDIPVVMLTSRTSSKHQEKAYQLGAKAFLNKPCKDEEFVDTVLRLTGNTAASFQDARREVIV